MIQAKIIPILTYGTESWLNVSKDQYKAMENILKEAISRILSLPGNTPYEAMLLEVTNFHVEAWMDFMKINYFMKKLHVKKSGKLYRILREDILNNNESGFIGDLRNICKKYEIPDITTMEVHEDYIRERCRFTSLRWSQEATMKLKKVPPFLVISKIWNHHYTFPMLEARAITTMRTGNLIFKNWCPNKIRPKYMGDMKCLYPPCQEPDTLKHVMSCEYYSTKFKDTGESIKDWAKYLVQLNDERIKEFKQPLICTDGWFRYDNLHE